MKEKTSIDEIIKEVAKQILIKHKKAFEELGK